MSPEECASQALRLLPPHTRSGFVAWALLAAPMGHFGTAVVKNDLAGALSRADLQSRERLHETVMWLRNYAPRGCWGSPDAVALWEGWPGLDRADALALLATL